MAAKEKINQIDQSNMKLWSQEWPRAEWPQEPTAVGVAHMFMQGHWGRRHSGLRVPWRKQKPLLRTVLSISGS